MALSLLSALGASGISYPGVVAAKTAERLPKVAENNAVDTSWPAEYAGRDVGESPDRKLTRI
jgi:hypothetical protein